MKTANSRRKWWSVLAILVSAFLPATTTTAEDIDIFVAGSGGTGAANVLVIIDNTSNWSTNKQNWPTDPVDTDCTTKNTASTVQGMAELCALIKVINALAATDDPSKPPTLNVGLMLMNHNGSGNCCTGGYVRYAIRPMNGTGGAANRTTFVTALKQIFDNISDPNYTTASDASYSMALFDAFKYFGGYTSPKHATDDVAGAPTGPLAFGTKVFATPPKTFDLPDPAAYTDPGPTTASGYTNYNPPSPSDAPCGGKNYIIFIGNSFPNSDTPPQEDMSKILTTIGIGFNPLPPGQLAMPVLTTTTSVGVSDTFGLSAACYANNANGLKTCNSDNASLCNSKSSIIYDTCTCGAPTNSTGCAGNQVKYTITGILNKTTVEPTGTTAPPPANKVRYADEFVKFLYDTDVSGPPKGPTGQQNVRTFTIDAFNAQQNADQTSLLYSMATAGHGGYYAAKNRNDIVTALTDIFAKIQATNDAFASAALPISANNRAFKANEVYIGMFRPDADAKPLWYGNLKRYQIAADNAGSLYLADVNKLAVVDTVGTGFVVDCATSWWTSDSAKYWWAVSSSPSPLGKCPNPPNKNDLFSDSPDGPQVEKGAVAEVIRLGNNAPANPDYKLRRTMYTNKLTDVGATAFAKFDTGTGMAQADVDFISGVNVDASPAGNYLTYYYNPLDLTKTTTIRPTVHGDVVHSRPMPVTYPTQTVLYYGANDGTFRAVDSVTGTELWAYVAPEFIQNDPAYGYSSLKRLRLDSPLVQYGSLSIAGAVPKNYHFDGSSGIYQTQNSSAAWIYPSMRRGGRMIYAFDVTKPAAPSLKWKVGCPHLGDDNNCVSNFDGIGQTWSTPNVALLKVGGTAAETPAPVVTFGGGYDNCEDGAPNNACAGAKGSVVYIVDADKGKLLQKLTLPAPAGRVAADVAYVDLDGDKVPDLAYAADTRGNVYRINFGLSRTAPLAAGTWTITKIASTSGANRKFLYAPAVLPTYDKLSGKFYVYVALGTGDREQPLVTQYPYVNPVVNRFYVYLDDISSAATNDLDKLCNFTPGQDNGCNLATTTTDACGNAEVVPGSGTNGWFMELNVCGPDAQKCVASRGEQVVTSALIFGRTVAFSTNRAIPVDANVCAPQGEARGYAVNLFTGSGVIGTQPAACGGDTSGVFTGGGLPPSPVGAAVCMDANCTDVQYVGLGVINLGNGGSSGIGAQKLPPISVQHRRRVYYRQEGDN